MSKLDTQYTTSMSNIQIFDPRFLSDPKKCEN